MVFSPRGQVATLGRVPKRKRAELAGDQVWVAGNAIPPFAKSVKDGPPIRRAEASEGWAARVDAGDSPATPRRGGSKVAQRFSAGSA